MATKNNFSWMLSVFLCLFISPSYEANYDTISANQSIYGDDAVISSGGTFALGFFSPGNSSKYYIGIFYKKVSEQTVVWVANRERPISDKNSSKLKIVDGNLILVDESKTTVWSTNTNFSSTNLVAVLLDDGNLVLKEYPGSNFKLWESFDHPTHTWLPEAKLAYNNHTKTSQRLTSWKNQEDPAPGLYSIELDPKGNQYIILSNMTVQIWATGAWQENDQTFSLVPEMRGRSANFKWTYVSNNNESYFRYSLENDSLFMTRFIMDYTGQIKQLTWLDIDKKWNLFWAEPKTQCEVNAYCGAYGACNLISFPFCKCLSGFKSRFEQSWSLRDYSGGCVRDIELECGNTNTSNRKKDKFGKYSYMKLPDNSQRVPSVDSDAACKSICLTNCSCTAYAYHDNACFTWSGDLFNMQQLLEDDISGKVMHIRLDSSEFTYKDNKVVVYEAVGGSIVVLLIILSGHMILVVIRRRRVIVAESHKALEGTLVAFGYRDLLSATKNFSQKLGRGGFGSVFKGTLPDLTVIAVKKLEGISQGEKQFRNEVSTIGNIQHVNLVHLLGFCSEGNEKLLVYEYMSNGSLDSHIFNAAEKILSWKTRYEIALGTAKGLVYLHEKCRDCIIHCDIKPENILLDADMCPKVADFGLAKLVGRDFSRVLTTMRGTRGYLAPEWISGVAVTAKADVYSYGKMLFEIVSGRRNLEQTTEGKVDFFPARAASVTIDGGDILSLLDTKLNRIANIEQVTNLCRVACWCIQDDENDRPSMSQIVQILEGILDVNLPPDPRGLQMFMDDEDDTVFYTDELFSNSLKMKSDPSSASKSSTSAQISKVSRVQI